MKMAPSQSLVDEVLYSILRREQAVAGAWIRLNAIRMHWRMTGFRVGDLVQSLARTSIYGSFYLTGQNNDAFLVVTKLPHARRFATLCASPLISRVRARCSIAHSAGQASYSRRLADRI